jgi:hypothetical protein
MQMISDSGQTQISWQLWHIQDYKKSWLEMVESQVMCPMGDTTNLYHKGVLVQDLPLKQKARKYKVCCFMI